MVEEEAGLIESAGGGKVSRLGSGVIAKTINTQ